MTTKPEDTPSDAPTAETAAPAAEAAAAEAEAADAPALDPMEAELLAVTTERDELKDRLLRALAENENIRKRAERDRKDAELYGGTKLARDLLSVHDNLGRALTSIDDDMRTQMSAVVEGLELTQRELLATFSKHKIEKVSPAVGDKFDPNLHQAMFEAPVPNAEPGSVIQVMAEGFTIADRLLRPAQVGVAAAAPDAGK